MPKKDPIKEQSWIKKIEDYRASGLSASSWCRKNQENLHTFKYWKTRLSSRSACPVDFEELETSSSKKGIKVVKRELSLYLPADTDEKTLKALIQAIRGC